MAVVFSLVVALGNRLPALAACLGAAVFLIGLARLRPSRLLWHLAVVNFFVLMLWLTLPLFTPGTVVGRLGPLRITREGLLHALLITVRSNAIILACTALLATMDMVRLGHALHHLGVPAKLVHVFLFTVRYLDIMHREYHRLRAAMKVRCFQPGTNRHTYRTYGYLVGMLLVNSSDRSERVLAAMKCRGFSGRLHILRHFVFARRDLVFLLTAGMFLSLLGFFQWAPMVH